MRRKDMTFANVREEMALTRVGWKIGIHTVDPKILEERPSCCTSSWYDKVNIFLKNRKRKKHTQILV